MILKNPVGVLVKDIESLCIFPKFIENKTNNSYYRFFNIDCAHSGHKLVDLKV